MRRCSATRIENCFEHLLVGNIIYFYKSIRDESGVRNCGVIEVCIPIQFAIGVVKVERMEGRRWFARDVDASLGWLFLLVLATEGCCGVLAADSAVPMEPNAAVSRAEEEEGCYRPMSDVPWGFLVTLIALTISLWGAEKYQNRHEAGLRATVATMLAGVCIPLLDLGQIVGSSLRCVSLLWICHKMEYPDSQIRSSAWLKFLCSSLLPWSKSPVRILASCDIVVYVSNDSPLLQRDWVWNSTSNGSEIDESEAMVVGEDGAREIRNGQYRRRRFSDEGIRIFVWKEMFLQGIDIKCLPKYDELKSLRGNSGFAVIAIAVQAFGYIYAVAFRKATKLRISPLEVIGAVFNIILLIKVCLYSTCNRCHRPLVVYVKTDWENNFRIVLDNNGKEKFEAYNPQILKTIIVLGIVVCLNVLSIYFVVSTIVVTKVVVVLPLICFLVGVWFDFLGNIIRGSDGGNAENNILVLAKYVNALAYIWAIVGVAVYWKIEHFDSRAKLLNVSQLIPFIG